MPLIALALRLPQVLLRLLLLALPFAPCTPAPSPRTSLGAPRASRRALSSRNDPARPPASFGSHACLAPSNPPNAGPIPQPAAAPPTPTPDRPQTPPKHTPPRLKSLLEKTLTAREAPAPRPSNTPSVPAPSPGLPAGPVQGTRHPVPVAPMGPPALPLAPPSARSFPASEARNFAQKNPPKPSLASPSPLGTGWRETVPPFTPTLLRPTPTPQRHVRSHSGRRPPPPKAGPDMPALALTGGTSVRSQPFPAWPVFPEQDIVALADRLRAGDRSDDDPVIEFEQAFAAAHGARYGIGLNSGTSALEIALQALRLDRGAEVIVSPITFFASVSAILNAGLVPIFTDIDPDTYNIAPAAIEPAITPRTGAIMTVHFGGVSCDMQAILAIAERHGLAVIEDAAHAHGGTWNDRGLGSIGDVGCFSCGSGKNLSAGGGGVLITSDPRIYERASGYGELNHPRRQRRRELTGVGETRPATEEFFPYASGNRRLHPVHAVLGLPQLARLDEQTARRDANGRYLAALLDDIEGVTPRRQDDFATRAANHLFVLRYDAQAFGGISRELFVKALNAEGIPCQTEYRRPMHRADLFTDRDGELSRVWPRGNGTPDVDYAAMSCPNAERACAEEMVTLPTRVTLDTRDGMEQILTAIEKIQSHMSELATYVPTQPSRQSQWSVSGSEPRAWSGGSN